MYKHKVEVYTLVKEGVGMDDLRLTLMRELREIREKLQSEEKQDSEKIRSLDLSLYNLTDNSIDESVNIPLYESLHNHIYLGECIYEKSRDLEPVEFDTPCRRFDILSEWEGLEEKEIVKLTPYGFSSNRN
jgi:hypothetical protein